jgi:hypothetical protein
MSTGECAAARGFVQGRDALLAFALLPRAGAGNGVAPARVDVDAFELTLRYER